MYFFSSTVGPSISPSDTISIPTSLNLAATMSRTACVLACGFVKTNALWRAPPAAPSCAAGRTARAR
eukprot:2892902-Prymnesium_polylepis.2